MFVPSVSKGIKMSSPDFSCIWSAVLIQTFRDLAPYRGMTLKGKRRIPYAMMAYEKDRKLALEWVLDPRHSPRSFIWVCDHLALDVKAVKAEAFKIHSGKFDPSQLFRVDMK